MEHKEPSISKLENQDNDQEKDPYTGIFFEVDVLIEKAKASCVERLKPLTIREPKEGELFACIEVFNYQDFGLNYNTFSENLDVDFEQLGDESAIPGLQEHIESHLEGKSASREQDEAFDEKLRKRLFDFFSSCWKQAGGEQAKTPTYFSFEKEEDQLMIFQTGKILSQEEVVSELESK